MFDNIIKDLTVLANTNISNYKYDLEVIDKATKIYLNK